MTKKRHAQHEVSNQQWPCPWSPTSDSMLLEQPIAHFIVVCTCFAVNLFIEKRYFITLRTTTKQKVLRPVCKSKAQKSIRLDQQEKCNEQQEQEQ